MDGRTDGKRENSIPTTNKVCGGYAYTKALLGKNCLSSHSCHFVKNYFSLTKLIHAYVQCVYIV